MSKHLLLLLPIITFAKIQNIIVESGLNIVIKSSKQDTSWNTSKSPAADLIVTNFTALVKPRNQFFRSKHASVVINLHGPLKSLEVRGDSNVILDNAETKSLKVLHYGSGNISLKGNIDLASIKSAKSGTIRVFWVNSKALNVESSYGQIELAGSCKSLKVLADKDAYFNGEYLRCENTWVRSKDYAFVKVQPLAHFKAWATGHSKVFYTRTVDYLNRDLMSLDNSQVMQVGS